MGGLDPAKLLVILVLALVLLGPERLPRAARQIGSLWRDVTAFRDRMAAEVREAIPELPELPALPKRGVAGYLTSVMTETSASQAVAGSGETVDDDPLGLGTTGVPAVDGVPPAAGFAAVPAGWGSTGADAPGYASGSLLSMLPSGAPDGLAAAEVRMDLDDPSWN